MCGRFTQRKDTAQIAEHYGVSEDFFQVTPRYNIAPTQVIAAINQKRQLVGFKWGLIPSWAKDPAIAHKLINARAETLQEKPSFRTALSKRRCLIPADGYYEWKKEGGGKQPYLFHRRGDALFSLAGLWEEWRATDGEIIQTCTIITTEPNELAGTVHNRMPAILKPHDEALWLDPAARVPDLVQLLGPYAGDDLEMYPVSKAVNSPGKDEPELAEPLK